MIVIAMIQHLSKYRLHRWEPISI